MELSRKRKKRRTLSWKIIALIVTSIVLVAGAILIYEVDRHLDEMEIDTSNVIMPDQNNLPYIEPLTQDPEEVEPEDFYTLMIGLDLRDNDFMLNTDSLIVAHMIPQTRQVKLLAIPRDQRVTNGQGKDVKINAVFAEGYQAAVQEARKKPDLLSGKRVNLGKYRVHEEYVSSGIAALRDATDRHLGIKIRYSFVINFNTVVDLVNAVGGVEINVDKSMRWEGKSDGTDIRLDKGLQLLNGKDALGFTRHRRDDRGSNYESSDFDRGRRQQEVITALMKKIVSWNNLPKALNLLDIVTTNVKTDMKRGKMISLMSDYYGQFSGESIESIPYPGEWISPFVEIKPRLLDELLEKFKAVDVPETDIPQDGAAPGTAAANQVN